MTILDSLFSDLSNIQIYFFDDRKKPYLYSFPVSQDFRISKILDLIQNQQKTKDLDFFDEIYFFLKDSKIQSYLSNSISKLWRIIGTSIIGYIIKQSYIKLNLNKNTNVFEKPVEDEDYIRLRNLGSGSSFRVDLIYHIEKSELFAIKIPICISDTQKLINREKSNYQNLNFPLLPKYYGVGKDN